MRIVISLQAGRLNLEIPTNFDKIVPSPKPWKKSNAKILQLDSKQINSKVSCTGTLNQLFTLSKSKKPLEKFECNFFWSNCVVIFIAKQDGNQWVSESDVDAAEFKTSEDPRGKSSRSSTEITLYIKHDATEYLEIDNSKN
ncbi:uncharacterized protein MELLADRAFT_102047 [Melampsora larici-populina 98AG31]|uniref:Uncharacterized protein n=1 Tax=Melampsora larici-populina (strain 98AG31 / pathotype 3-4-7) TaxID=747676 RepID=F4R5U1_MELLP|nr:uncharacterized protein MELLADRAFT_102047 [Melampsora larici-populina 98AG31]EGG12098.1 hypothetical protein MELLADRAFT_102047 [Melampsora larici-populina 98AG31]